MDNLQKWLIVIAVCIIAISMLLFALKGRYVQHPRAPSRYIDSWTGKLY